MGTRIYLPRLTKGNVQGLLAAHQKAVTVHQTLKGTNWAGAPACIVLVGDIDLLICELANKAEQVILRAQAPAAAPSPEEAPAPSSPAEEDPKQ